MNLFLFLCVFRKLLEGGAGGKFGIPCLIRWYSNRIVFGGDSERKKERGGTEAAAKNLKRRGFSTLFYPFAYFVPLIVDYRCSFPVKIHRVGVL